MSQTPAKTQMEATLFGCFDDCGDCMYCSFCGPCHLGSIAKKTDTGNCCGTTCIAVILSFPLIYQCYAKGVVTSALEKVGVTHEIGCCQCVFCWSCVQAQASREITNRQARASATAAPTPVSATK